MPGSAIWRAGSQGNGVSVRIITKRPDQVVGFGDSRAILPTVLIEVRRSEVAGPTIGCIVELEAETFEIIATPTAGSLGLIWTCEAAPNV